MTRFFRLSACLVTLTGASFVAAHAQPDPNNAPKATNPTNRPARGNRLMPTPEQQRERARQASKNNFARLGVLDATAQNALALYVESESDARQSLLERGRLLQLALRNLETSEAQIGALLNDYNATLEENRARRQKAQIELAKSFDVLKNPRIEAFLTVQGIWNDGPTLPNAPAPRGGPRPLPNGNIGGVPPLPNGTGFPGNGGF